MSFFEIHTPMWGVMIDGTEGIVLGVPLIHTPMWGVIAIFCVLLFCFANIFDRFLWWMEFCRKFDKFSVYKMREPVAYIELGEVRAIFVELHCG